MQKILILFHCPLDGKQFISVTPFLLSEVLHRDASNAVILDVDMLRAHIVALDGAST